jgi:hypothetical protein
MQITINADLTALLLDDGDSPTKMLRMPSYDVETLNPFSNEAQAYAQAKKYAVKPHLFGAYISPEEEAAALLAEQTAQMRATRNELLTSCDWTQVADAPIDKEAWANYRQSLRDLPSQEGFPNEITWPTEPVEEVAPE